MKKGRIRYFLQSFILLSLVAGAFLSLFFYHVYVEHESVLIVQAREAMHLEKEVLREVVHGIHTDILFLKEKALSDVKGGNGLSDSAIRSISQNFYHFLRNKPDYSQIRLLGMNGKELIRFNRQNDQVRMVSKDKLQNKLHRYYFSRIMGISSNKIYFSGLDLNVENKKIKRPFSPTIRVGVPLITSEGVRIGALVLNYNAQDLLNRLKRVRVFNIGEPILMTENGYFIIGFHSDEEWGHSILSRSGQTAKILYPNLWNILGDLQHGVAKTNEGFFLRSDLTSDVTPLENSDLKLILVWKIPLRLLTPTSLPYYFIASLIILFVNILISFAWSFIKVKQWDHAKRLEILSKTDQLTGLSNRNEIIRLGNIEMERSSRYHYLFSLLMLDLDWFKKLNDQYGHLKGDEALVSFSKACLNVIRKTDYMGRYGGEEFVIILPHTSLDESISFARRIKEEVANIRIPIENDFIKFTVSIGLSMCRPTDQKIEEILNRADENLYRAKRHGRNLVISDNYENELKKIKDQNSKTS